MTDDQPTTAAGRALRMDWISEGRWSRDPQWLTARILAIEAEARQTPKKMERVAALAAILHGLGVRCDWYENTPYSQEPGPVMDDGKIWTVKVTEATYACKAPHDQMAWLLYRAFFEGEIDVSTTKALDSWDGAAFLNEGSTAPTDPAA